MSNPSSPPRSSSSSFSIISPPQSRGELGDGTIGTEGWNVPHRSASGEFIPIDDSEDSDSDFVLIKPGSTTLMSPSPMPSPDVSIDSFAARFQSLNISPSNSFSSQKDSSPKPHTLLSDLSDHPTTPTLPPKSIPLFTKDTSNVTPIAVALTGSDDEVSSSTAPPTPVLARASTYAANGVAKKKASKNKLRRGKSKTTKSGEVKAGVVATSGSDAPNKNVAAEATSTHTPKKSKRSKRKSKLAKAKTDNISAKPAFERGVSPLADVSDLSEEDSDTDWIYKRAIRYISDFMKSPHKDKSNGTRLALIQALLIELRITPTLDSIPHTIRSAKQLLKTKVFINIHDYIKFRDQGIDALRQVMFSSRRALAKDVKKRPVKIEFVKSKGLEVFLTNAFHFGSH
jgi:hypothetical protein